MPEIENGSRDAKERNFLDHWMQLLSEAETPSHFIYWSGLAVLSSVVRDKIWLPKRLYRLYPNIFIMMIGKSGLKKSFPVSKAKELVTRVNGTRVISGQNSIQGIIAELATVKTDEKTGNVQKDSHASIFAEEFGDLIVEDPSAFKTLTNLYDRHYHSEFVRTLKNSPKQKLTNVTITMLAASSPSYFKSTVSDIHITGGFLARFLVLYGDRKSKLNPLVDDFKEGEIIYDAELLVPHLRKLEKLTGPFKWEEDARYLFKQWYYNFFGDGSAAGIPKEREDETGFEDRVNDHILKIAMLLALAEPNPELVLQAKHIEKSIELCTELSTAMNNALMGVGRNPLANAMQLVLRALLEGEEHKVRRDELLMKFHGEFTYDELDRIEMTLSEAELIEVEHMKGKTIYTLTKKAINRYQKKKKGKP
jgi:hypothetical protein